jgi:hypothetical protein
MNVQVVTPAHVADAVATAGQNNHVHSVTGGHTINTANR